MRIPVWCMLRRLHKSMIRISGKWIDFTLSAEHLKQPLRLFWETSLSFKMVEWVIFPTSASVWEVQLRAGCSSQQKMKAPLKNMPIDTAQAAKF